jgi:hypothetical protein
MTVMVGANVKDENYFAEPRGLTARASVTGADRRPNWRKTGRPASLLNEIRGEPSPLQFRKNRAGAPTSWCR